MNKLEKFNNFVIFQTEEGKVNIDVFFVNDTLWLTQKLMAELFEVKPNTVSYHLKEIFESGELQRDRTVRNFRLVQKEGEKEVSRDFKFYSLDSIIAVGYRVNSKRATNFRIWATQVLNELIVKGFAIDDERLKQIKHFGKDYFEELVERIREIRSSERRLYQKITDIYSLSADYDKDSEATKEFFATVQNKLHWAITGKTAAEIIYSEADARKIYMGLKSDVTIAKSYLNEEHVKELERIVSAYLDLAENRATRQIVMNMRDWVKFLNDFLKLSDYPILAHKGKVSALKAKLKAESEYKVYRIKQDKDFISDFDKEVKRLVVPGKKPK